jgi:hypothetical protein
MRNLEKRMYFFVPYQLTGIQQGIQCGHAALEYTSEFGHTLEYKDFVKNWKTWIVLNGGSTNNDPQRLGSLNILLDELESTNINVAYFCEPDLQDAVTAVCFICDERVWNYEKYPDYDDKLYGSVEGNPWEKLFFGDGGIHHMNYDMWLAHCIGGNINLTLRNILKGKRLA